MTDVSPRAQLAYDKLKSSGMSDWVGAGDPIAVGAESFNAIAAVMELRPDMQVLDFGCGIGRMSIPMADFLTKGELVGIDIVPKMIAFCQQTICPIFPNASFLLSADKNPLYEKFREPDASPQDIHQWAVQKGRGFDLIYAFSVFTHFDPEMVQSTLDLFSHLLKPSGLVFITAFLDNEDNPSDRKLGPEEKYRDCCPAEPLHFAVHTPDSLIGMAHKSGLSVHKVLYGYWRGTLTNFVKGKSFQDALVLGQPIPIPADFDPDLYVSLHPDLVAAKVDGTVHYRNYGFFEKRRYR